MKVNESATTYYDSYETLYENEVEAFLTAAESGDEEALIKFFPASRREDPELRRQISELIASFPGPVDSREEAFSRRSPVIGTKVSKT